MAKKKTKKPNFLSGTSLEAHARVIKTRITASGKTTRAKGHLSASTRRSQARRDMKNS